MGFLFGMVVGFFVATAFAAYAPQALLVPAGMLIAVVDFVKKFFKKDGE